MNDLFRDLPEPEQPMTLLPPVQIRCSVCGTDDVFRVQPGQLASATGLWYRADLLSDAVDVPSVAYCLSCDPAFSGVVPRVPDGDAEYASWRAA